MAGKDITFLLVHVPGRMVFFDLLIKFNCVGVYKKIIIDDFKAAFL